MAAPKWWQIESIQAKRQREREVLDTVTRDVGGYLARGDVTGARRALADAAPNPNVPAAMKWERDLKSRLRQKFTPFQLHEPGTGPNDKDGGGGSLLGKVAKGAAQAATLANPLTSGAAVAGEVARRTGLMDKAEENAPKPVRTATSFGAALTSPLPTALNAVAGDKEARANVNRFISGERLGNDLGLPASEGLNKLREHGFTGRVAATALDQAFAPATYAGGVGIGQGFANLAGKRLAVRWAQEVGAATVGTVAGEEAAKFAASKTDNPYVVGAAGLGVGLLAGGAAYNPAATARGASRAGRAVGSAVAEDARRVAADPRAAGRRLLADEAGQAQVIPRGTRIAHGSSAPLEGDLRASEYGALGKGVYGDVNDPEVQLARYFALRAARDAQVQVPSDVLMDSTKFEDWVMAHPELQDAAAGANITPLTPLRDLNALRADMPVDKAELKAVRMALEPKQRAEFNRLVRDSAMDAEPLGGDVRFALVQMGDGTGEDFANGVLKKAGFDAMAGDNISKWGTSEVSVFDPNDLESHFDYAARQLVPVQNAAQAAEIRAAAQATQQPSLRVVDQLTPQRSDTAARLGRFVKRKAGLGQPANERIVFSDAQGEVVLGRLTKDDWLRRVQTYITNPEEMAKSRYWYEDLHQGFEQLPPDDRELFALAWLLSQQQASPSGGMMNVLRAEDVGRFGYPELKAAGLNKEALYKLFKGEAPDKGAGAKLLDFIDSAELKSTRRVMGDAPEGGTPAVIDVWSGRDTGLVDGPMINYIRKRFGDAAADGLKKDFDGGVPEVAYEASAQQYRDIADWLNFQNFDGGGWTPAQVQAAGWWAMQKAMGATPQSVADIFTNNTRRISFELSFGEGSPLSQKFDFNALEPAAQRQVTDEVLTKMVERIQQVIPNARIQRVVHSLGGWEDYPPAPSWQVDVFGSPETIQDTADALGFLAQQTGMLVSRPMKSGATKGLDVIFPAGIRNDDEAFIGDLWSRLRQREPELFRGFQPTEHTAADGTVFQGIRMLDIEGDWKGAAKQKRLQAALTAAIEETPHEGDFIVRPMSFEVSFSGNDWKEVQNGKGYLDGITARGRSSLASALDDPALASERDAWVQEAFGRVGQQPKEPRPGFLADAAGQVDTGLAANLATGAAGAAYGYATGDDTQDRWKRALAFGVGGLAGGAAVRVGVRAAAPGALPTTAPPRPASVLSAPPPDAVENSYTTASGIQRIVPKVGTAAAARAVAAKQEALKVPGRVMEVLPPVVRNGVALLNPSVNQDQQVLVAWRAGQAVRAQLQTEWTAALNPLVERVDALLPTAVYRGPRGTAADLLIGTAKDIADHPELYDISPELRSALDDLNVAMWDEVAGRARADYGVDVRPYEGEGKPGFVYLPTVAAKDSLDDKLMNAFDSLSTKSMAKRRGYVSARDRLVDPETGQTPEAVKRAIKAGAKEFVPETDLRELVSAHIQAMASNAGHATMKEGAGGRMLGDVLDELHPGIAEAKTRTRAFVTNLNSRMKTAVAVKADTLKRISLNDTQMRQLEKRMQPLENRIAALEAESEFGPELSYLSGQVRELRMMRGKIANYAKTLEGRKNFNEAKIKTLDDAIDSAQSALDDVVKRYESAGTDPYVRDPLTQRWYTPEAAKTMKQLLARPAGFGKNLADISDEIRAWHLAGDASLGTIQGALGVMSDPLTAAKTARKMLAGGNPKAELARLAQAEADDVAEYTFATGRVFGEPLTEIRQSARGFERVPGIRTAQDQLSALFERGSYEAWKRERDIVLHENPGMSRSLAGHEAANMLSKVVPGLNPAERGVSGTRGAIERGALTSVSFATSPALLGAEAAKGTAELARQAALKLMRSPSVNPDGAWAALTAREQIALRRTVMLAGTVTALSTASAILAAPSRNMSIEDAVQESFDPSSRYFSALQLGEGRSIPLGGPFRSAIKAIVPRDGVMFAGVPSWVGTRINSPAKPIIDLARNRDFQNDPIYEGNFARPENLARALWYFGGEGIAPVSAGQVSEDVRRGEFDPGGTSQRVIAQFLGSNLSPVSPTEKLSQLSRAIYQKEFYDLLPKEREAIKKAQPKLWEEAVAAGSDARQQAEAQKTKLREAQQADDDLFLQGKLTLEKWSQATDDRSNQLVGAEDVLFADAKGKASKPVSPVLESYYQQIDASAKANNGRVDWGAIDTWKSGLSKADQKTIDENTGLNKTPLVKLKSDLQKQYYSLPRYRGYTADQAVAIDDLWQEVRNNASSSDDAAMLAAMRKNPALTRGVDAKVVEGVKRRILGLLAEDTSRKNWAKAHPEAAVFLRRGKLTAQDSVAIKKALGGAPR